MKNNTYITLLLAMLAGMTLTACQQPPDDEIMAAEDALKSAKNAGAEELSPNLFGKAQSALQEAKMLNEQGKYSDARKQADFARMRAEQAEKYATGSSTSREARSTE